MSAARQPHARFAPTRNLVLVAAAALVPPALLETLAPVWALVLVILSGVLALAAIGDIMIALPRARGVSATLGPLTRVSLGRPGELEGNLRVTADGPRRIRIGLSAPDELGLDVAETDVVFAADKETAGARVTWRIHPRRRGVYRLDELHVQLRSPLGWWYVRWLLPVKGEVRVYPNLMRESRRLAALFLRRPAPGWRNQRQIGRGREFEQLREYVPGDGFDEVHWKATAKRGHPVTKVFQVERTQEIYAIVDASRLSGRRSVAVPSATDAATDDTLLERQANAALSVALAAEKQRDLFGLVTFTDRSRHFVRAKNGPAHFQACREALVQVQPTPVSPDFREVCTFLRARLTKRALLVFFTSLDDPALAEDFLAAVSLVARQHLVLVIAPLPPEAQPLFSGAAPERVEGVYGRLAGHLRWQGLQELHAQLHRHGVQFVLLDRDELAAGAVAQYMTFKQRQAI